MFGENAIKELPREKPSFLQSDWISGQDMRDMEAYEKGEPSGVFVVKKRLPSKPMAVSDIGKQLFSDWNDDFMNVFPMSIEEGFEQEERWKEMVIKKLKKEFPGKNYTSKQWEELIDKHVKPEFFGRSYFKREVKKEQGGFGVELETVYSQYIRYHIDPFGFSSSSPMERENLDTAPGGIDFNPGMLDLTEQGQGMDFHFDNSIFQNIQPNSVYGIRPVIINIAPIINLAPLLGLSTEEEELELSRAN